MSVKRIIITFVGILFFSISANAQFSAVGGRAGLGFAKISDDLFMHSTLGYNVGGYVNYSFWKRQRYLAPAKRLFNAAA